VFIDLDQSGRKTSRPDFDRMMERVRLGQSGGVIVSRLDRLGRTTRGVLDAIAEVEQAGGKFIAVRERLDTSTSTGRFVLTMFAALAELELERYTEQWQASQADFLARNGHGGSFTPAGYDRLPSGQLAPNADADAIRQAFKLRAEGATLREVGQYLHGEGVLIREHGQPGQKGYRPAHTDWRESAVRQMLANRLYLGVARAGGREKEGAHEAIVTLAEFDAAAAQRRAPGRAQNGVSGEGALLTGLLLCGTCGSPLTNDGKRYRCNSRGHRATPCERKAVVERRIVEPHVERLALDFLGRIDFKRAHQGAGPRELEQGVKQAEAELRAYVELTPATTLGYADGLRRREDTLARRRQALAAAGGADEEYVLLDEVRTEQVYRSMAIPKQRLVMGACVERVVVMPGTGAAQDRIEVTFKPHPLRKTARPSWVTEPLEYVAPK